MADVLGERIAMDFPIPDTGSVDDDLRQLARAFVAWVTSPTGRMIFAAVYGPKVRKVTQCECFAAAMPGTPALVRAAAACTPQHAARATATLAAAAGRDGR